MNKVAPIEITVRYATTVESLPEAWAFVMNHVDLVGSDPSIEISPHWHISVHDMGREPDEKPVRHFGVVVSGMTDDGDQS